MTFTSALLVGAALGFTVAVTGEMDYQDAVTAEEIRRASWCECVTAGHTDSEMAACDRRFSIDGELDHDLICKGE